MRIGGEDLLSWNGADPDQTLHTLLAAVARLLQPDVGDSASFGVGEVRRFMSLRFCGTHECRAKLLQSGIAILH